MLTALREAVTFDPGPQSQLDTILVGRNEEDEYPDLSDLSPSNPLFGLFIHKKAKSQRKWKVIHVAHIGYPSVARNRVEKDRSMYGERQVEGTSQSHSLT